MGKKDQYGIVTGIGGDVHRTFTTVAMRDAEGRVVRRERLDHRDRAGMLEQMRRWPSGLPLVVEASFGWGWVTDLALEAGLCPMLSNCYKVEQMRKARGLVKTNNKDAELLSQLMDEPKQWWRVWLAPTEVRDRREQMRSRTDLVRVSTQTKNRIHALFHRHGILHDFSDLFGARGRVFLGQLCLDGRTGPVRLEAGALEALRTQVRLLDHLRKQLADRTRTLRRQLQGDPLVARLTGIPGIGLILAHTLVAEIGRIERFANHRKLASYSLLGPRSDDTGEADSVRAPRGRHLGHRGNSTLQ